MKKKYSSKLRRRYVKKNKSSSKFVKAVKKITRRTLIKQEPTRTVWFNFAGSYGNATGTKNSILLDLNFVSNIAIGNDTFGDVTTIPLGARLSNKIRIKKFVVNLDFRQPYSTGTVSDTIATKVVFWRPAPQVSYSDCQAYMNNVTGTAWLNSGYIISGSPTTLFSIPFDPRIVTIMKVSDFYINVDNPNGSTSFKKIRWVIPMNKTVRFETSTGAALDMNYGLTVYCVGETVASISPLVFNGFGKVVYTSL